MKPCNHIFIVAPRILFQPNIWKCTKCTYTEIHGYGRGNGLRYDPNIKKKLNKNNFKKMI